ncbi:MAG: hypothetical protein FWF51_11280 [Chitinivibrionia bacterium]|nr:hypothetical protein [Chitinivibrionia bacterium]
MKAKVVYDGEKENLPKKFGDFSFNIATAIFIGLFLEIILMNKEDINIISLVFGGVFFMFFFIMGILMYQKGGLK